MKKLYIFILLANIFGTLTFSSQRSNSPVDLMLLDLSVKQKEQIFNSFLQNNQLSEDKKLESKKIKELFQDCKISLIYLSRINNLEKLDKDEHFKKSNLLKEKYLAIETEECRQDIIELENALKIFLTK